MSEQLSPISEEAAISLISRIKKGGLLALLEYCNEENLKVTTKIGGTAVKNLAEEGKGGPVYKVIKSMQDQLEGNLLDVVCSAWGKVGDNEKKVTERLIEAHESKSINEGWKIILGITQDHRNAFEKLFEKNKEKAKRGERFLNETEQYLRSALSQDDLFWSQDQVKDMIIASGEHMGTFLSTLLLDRKNNRSNYIDSRKSIVDYDPNTESSYSASERLIAGLREQMKEKSTNFFTGHSGVFGEKGSYGELGSGYSDSTAVMLDNLFTVFLKQSGAILEADPKKVEGIKPDKIKVIPLSCLGNLARGIENNIQVIQKRAVEELIAKQGWAFVADEEGSSDKGTLLVPDDIYYKWREQTDNRESPVMMGNINHIREIRIDFSPSSDDRRSLEKQKIIDYIKLNGGKVYNHIENGGRLLVSGVENIEKSDIVGEQGFVNVKDITLGEESMIVAVAFGESKALQNSRHSNRAKNYLTNLGGDELISEDHLISYLVPRENILTSNQHGEDNMSMKHGEQKIPYFLGRVLECARKTSEH